MKLPVKPKGDRDIIDADGAWVCFANTIEGQDYIVTAINSHEKLVDLAKDLDSGLKYLRHTNSEPYGFGIDRLETKLQALKEAKKK